MRQPEPVGGREVRPAEQLGRLRPHGGVLDVVHGGHARRRVDQQHDLGPALAVEGELRLRQQDEQREQERGEPQGGGQDEPAEPADRPPLAAVDDEREDDRDAGEGEDDPPVGEPVADERGEPFEPPAGALARGRGGNADRLLGRVPPVVRQEAEQVAGPLGVEHRDQREHGRRQRDEGRGRAEQP